MTIILAKGSSNRPRQLLVLIHLRIRGCEQAARDTVSGPWCCLGWTSSDTAQTVHVLSPAGSGAMRRSLHLCAFRCRAVSGQLAGDSSGLRGFN